MDREELYQDMIKNIETIKSTASMRELDHAQLKLQDEVELFATEHRDRINYWRNHD